MRKSISPIKQPSILPRVYEKVGIQQRDIIIRKLKEDLIVAKGKAKQISILQHYVANLQQKTHLLQLDRDRIQEQIAVRLQAGSKVVNQEKNQVELLRIELKNINKQLDQQQITYDELKRHLNIKIIQIEKLKKDGFYLYAQNQKLMEENFKLRSQFQNCMNENRRVEQTKFDLDNRNNDIKNKIIQVKSYHQTLISQSKILNQKLDYYNEQRKKLGINIDRNEDKVDELEHIFILKHDQIKQQIQIYIQKEHQNEKYLQQTRHKLHLLRIENQKTQQLIYQINNIEKTIKERQLQRNEINNQNYQISKGIEEYSQNNQQLRKDLQKCQQHLDNIANHNSLLTTELQRYRRDDEGIINLIRYKKRNIAIPQSFHSVRSPRRRN